MNADKKESEETAKYFENFKYAAELTDEEYNRTISLFREIDDKDINRNEKRRNIIIGIISQKAKRRAKDAFLEKIIKLEQPKQHRGI